MTLEDFVNTLQPKVAGTLQGTAKIDLTDLGQVFLSEDGAEISDQDADVVLSATSAVFQAILDGSQNPMMAYMSGKLKIDGSVGRALKVSEIVTS
ncbi:MAG: SCP2 sterol-binding domain-containing protein [Pseudomonadota bacterium]